MSGANIIYGAAFDHRRQRLFYGLLEPENRRDLGIWALDLGSGETPKRLAAAREPLEDVPGYSWNRSLYLTPDGTRLVVRECQSFACAVRVYSASDGRLETEVVGLRDDAVFGITSHELVGVLTCDPACAISALDLSTGSARTISADPCMLSGSGLIGRVAGGSDLLLVESTGDSACPTRPSVLAQPIGDAVSDLAWRGASASEGGQELGLAVRGSRQGYSLPDGWFLLAPAQDLALAASDEGLGARLVDADRGTEVPVDLEPPDDVQ